MSLAQAQVPKSTPTPDALNVTLVDEGKGSFRDFVVPITTLVAALVGGIGGVFIGGRMNRATMRTLEAERAEREDRLDAAKARRDEAAERRLARGSLRLVVDQFAIAASNLAIERDKAGDNPLFPESIDARAHVRAEDKHAIAMWVSDDIWRLISLILERIELHNVQRALSRKVLDAGRTIDADEYSADAGESVTAIKRAISRLEPELRRLEAQ